jgi:hypothetical protein
MIRQKTADAFIDLIKSAKDDELFTLNATLKALHKEEPKIFTALLGHTLMNDIIQAVAEASEERAAIMDAPVDGLFPPMRLSPSELQKDLADDQVKILRQF